MVMHNTPMSKLFQVRDFKSDYLCNSCGGLLYCDLEDATLQSCINPACKQCNREFTIIDPSAEASPQLHKELADEEAKRPDIERELTRPGSKARNVRGSLDVNKFKSIALLKWLKPTRFDVLRSKPRLR